MPPYKKPSAAERKTAQEQAISLVLTGSRNLLIPLFNAEYVYVNHPVKLQTLHVKVLGPVWDTLMVDLHQYGLLPSVAKELDILAEKNVDSAKWQTVSAAFRSKYVSELTPVESTAKTSK